MTTSSSEHTISGLLHGGSTQGPGPSHTISDIQYSNVGDIEVIGGEGTAIKADVIGSFRGGLITDASSTPPHGSEWNDDLLIIWGYTVGYIKLIIVALSEESGTGNLVVTHVGRAYQNLGLPSASQEDVIQHLRTSGHQAVVATQTAVATNAMTDDADWTKTNGYVNGTETWIFGATGATCDSQTYYEHVNSGLFGSFLLYTGSTITETSNYVACSAAIKAVDDDTFGMVFLNSDDDQTHYLLYVSTTYRYGTSSYILLFKRVDGTRTFIGRVPTSGDGSFNTSPYTAEFITYEISQTIDADGTVRIQLKADGVPLKLQLESDSSVVESYVDLNPIHTGRNGFFSAGNHGHICKDFRQEHHIEIPAPMYDLRDLVLRISPPQPTICFHENTLIQTDQGEVLIKNITCNHTIEGCKVIYLIKSPNIPSKVVKIEKHAFGLNKPNREIILTRNHIIIIGDQCNPIEYYLNNKKINLIHNKSDVYNIMLLNKKSIIVDNLTCEVMNLSTKQFNLFNTLIKNNNVNAIKCNIQNTHKNITTNPLSLNVKKIKEFNSLPPNYFPPI